MGMDKLIIRGLLDLDKTIAGSIFEDVKYPWEVLPLIHDYVVKLGATLSKEEYTQMEDNIWISKTASIAPSASITGPVIIGHNAEIRHCAYVRGNAIIGEGSVIGNSTEIKNVILFDKVQIPHFNYVGDSVLGYKAHLGAGTITSNVKSDKTPIKITIEEQRLDTELLKFGAILGDYVEVGSNSVLNPGCVVGRNTNIYPLSMVRGYITPNSIYKKQGEVVTKR